MYQYECVVVRIIDGDTIDVSIDLGFNIRVLERVRLRDVDAPEIRGVNASEHGYAAMYFVESWVNDHIETCSQEGEFIYESTKYNQRGKYGRCIGDIICRCGLSLSNSLDTAIKKNGWDK